MKVGAILVDQKTQPRTDPTPSSFLPNAMSLPQSFLSKKRKILDQLSIPDSEYDDLSPKGSIDVGIRDLIDEINAIEGCVTTSSCAGRISVFLEGKKTPETYHDGGLEAERGASGVGGKGGGGRWLFVSHDSVDIEEIEKREKGDGVTPWTEFLGMEAKWTMGASRMIETPLGESRFVHFKFEPMVLPQPSHPTSILTHLV
jgi:tRNA wybutosine-synthesizing protein 3